MKSFTRELVSNASVQLFLDITLSTFTKILVEQLNLEGQLELGIAEKPYKSRYHLVKKSFGFGETFSKSSTIHYLEPGLYPSLTDFVEAMNELVVDQTSMQDAVENC